MELTRAQKQANRKLELERVQRYQECFGTDAGKWVFNDIREQFGDLVSFNADSVRLTDYQEGRRYLYLYILKLLTYKTKPLIEEILKNEEAE